MIQLNSPAKLNLYLEVLKKRADGYHNIRTIFERVSLNDKITIKKNKSGCIRIRTTSKDIPKDSANIVYKAASLLRSDFDIREGVDIQIKKRIPVGAGLGGGSSNAASALIGLNLLWNLKLSRDKLLRYGDKLGSDVAFFLHKCSFAIGLLRGNKINILNKLKKNFWHIVVVPEVKVSTRDIYEEFDKIDSKRLNVLSPRQLLRLDGDSVENILFNRLEEVTFKKYPIVKKIKEILEAQGVRKTLMSGSGGSVFGIVKSRKEGLRIAKSFKDSRNLKVFVVRTAQ